jgi:hypothetical protein
MAIGVVSDTVGSVQDHVERSRAEAERPLAPAEDRPVRRAADDSAAIAGASAAAAEVVGQLGSRAASPVIRRKLDYSPLQPELEGRNAVAVLPWKGNHVSIVDPEWTYQFDEFHVTEETEGKGARGNPHFFFKDDGTYLRDDTIKHGQTRMYWNKIGKHKPTFEKTETHAKTTAKDFLAYLRAKLDAKKPPVKPPAAPAAAKAAPPAPVAKPAADPTEAAKPAPKSWAAMAKNQPG